MATLVNASLPSAADCSNGTTQCSPLSSTEFLCIAPFLLIVMGFLVSRIHLPKTKEAWSVLVNGKIRHAPLPSEVATITRLWSSCLFVGVSSMMLLGVQLSIPLQAIISGMCISGIFIGTSFFQTLFHVSCTCGWFALFDMLVYTEPDARLISLMLSLKGVICAFLISGTIIRLQLGNNWQFSDPYHLTVGFVVILCYFCLIELPACGVYNMDLFCSYFGTASNQYLHSSWPVRLGEIIKMLVAHLILNFALYYYQADLVMGNGGKDELESPPTNESTPISNQDLKKASEEDLTRRFSGATDTEDDNQTITDETGQQRKLPEDCVEITEAEAIEIIQNGLNSFKKKRAT